MKQLLIMITILFTIAASITAYLWLYQQKQVEERGPTLAIDFLDIGQGDATLLTFPTGEQMLIDCAIDARVIEALGRVMDFYDRTIEYLALTHPDLDHYGGCADVFARFDIQYFVTSGVEKENQSYEALRAAIEAEGAEVIELSESAKWSLGDVGLWWLYPEHDLEMDPDVPGPWTSSGANDTSLVVKVEYGETTVLLPGDAEHDLEYFLVDQYGEYLDADILKGGHHGSAGSSMPEFLEAVSPDHTVFSAGEGNSYGHPSPRAIARVERVGSEVWRTDEDGDVELVVTENGYYFE